MVDDTNNRLGVQGSSSSDKMDKQGLTTEVLVDLVTEFSKHDLDIIVGMTFNPKAWEEMKAKYEKKVDFDKPVFIQGLPCYVLNKQEEACIGWYNEQAMQMWVEADASEFIEKLPELKTKGSA